MHLIHDSPEHTAVKIKAVGTLIWTASLSIPVWILHGKSPFAASILSLLCLVAIMQTWMED